MSSQMPPMGPPPGMGAQSIPPQVLQELQMRAQQGDPQAIQMLQQLMGGGGSPPPPMDPSAQMNPQQVPGMVQGLRGG